MSYYIFIYTNTEQLLMLSNISSDMLKNDCSIVFPCIYKSAEIRWKHMFFTD